MFRDVRRVAAAKGAQRLWAGVMVVVFLAGCSSATPPTLVPVVTPTLAPSSSGTSSISAQVTASGVVAPAQKADLSFVATGLVDEVKVKVGDRAQAGQVLLQLKGQERLAAEVANASQQVAAAQQEAESAQQALEAAQKEILDAHQAITDMLDSSVTALNLAQSQMAIADLQRQIEDANRSLKGLTAPDIKYYQDQVTQAQNALTNATQNASLVDTGQLQIDLRNAEKQLQIATDVYNNAKDAFADCPSCDKVWAYDRWTTWIDAKNLYADAASRVEQIRVQIDQSQRGGSQSISDAQDALKKATDRLNYYLKGPDALRVAQAQAQVGLLQARLAKAQSDDQKLRANNGVDKDRLKVAQDRVTAAEQAAAAARARIATAQARLPAAQAALTAAQAALDDLTLKAPFTGIIVALNVGAGEAVLPGQVVIRLGDLDHLQIETTDLSEKDLGGVEVGQAANVYVEALRADVKGQVTRIAAEATKLGGDVVYAVTLDLAEQPAGLRWGMSVKVDFAGK